MYALMMQCRAGTRRVEYNPLRWVDDMHDVTVSAHPTAADAYEEMARLQPRGFNRERIRLWVVPWHERFT